MQNQGNEDFEFKLLNKLEEGVKVSESEVYQLANALSSLQLSDVKDIESLNLETVEPVITTFKTYGGLTVIAESYTVDSNKYTLFKISFNQDDVVIRQNEDQVGIKTETDHENMKIIAESTTNKVQGWAYVLPDITSEALVKTLEDFILVQEEDA